MMNDRLVSGVPADSSRTAGVTSAWQPNLAAEGRSAVRVDSVEPDCISPVLRPRRIKRKPGPGLMWSQQHELKAEDVDNELSLLRLEKLRIQTWSEDGSVADSRSVAALALPFVSPSINDDDSDSYGPDSDDDALSEVINDQYAVDSTDGDPWPMGVQGQAPRHADGGLQIDDFLQQPTTWQGQVATKNGMSCCGDDKEVVLADVTSSRLVVDKMHRTTQRLSSLRAARTTPAAESPPSSPASTPSNSFDNPNGDLRSLERAWPVIPAPVS